MNGSAWRDVRELAAHKIVPVHSGTAWYYFGGITLFLFGIQVVTGHPAAALLPAHGRRSLRQRAVHHDPRAVRLADPVDP